MNVAAKFFAKRCRMASPYARRLAREKHIALVDLTGSGPNRRIAAADVFACEVPVTTQSAEQTAASLAIL